MQMNEVCCSLRSCGLIGHWYKNTIGKHNAKKYLPHLYLWGLFKHASTDKISLMAKNRDEMPEEFT